MYNTDHIKSEEKGGEEVEGRRLKVEGGRKRLGG